MKFQIGLTEIFIIMFSNGEEMEMVDVVWLMVSFLASDKKKNFHILVDEQVACRIDTREEVVWRFANVADVFIEYFRGWDDEFDHTQFPAGRRLLHCLQDVDCFPAYTKYLYGCEFEHLRYLAIKVLDEVGLPLLDLPEKFNFHDYLEMPFD